MSWGGPLELLYDHWRGAGVISQWQEQATRGGVLTVPPVDAALIEKRKPAAYVAYVSRGGLLWQNERPSILQGPFPASVSPFSVVHDGIVVGQRPRGGFSIVECIDHQAVFRCLAGKGGEETRPDRPHTIFFPPTFSNNPFFISSWACDLAL